MKQVLKYNIETKQLLSPHSYHFQRGGKVLKEILKQILKQILKETDYCHHIIYYLTLTTLTTQRERRKKVT